MFNPLRNLTRTSVSAKRLIKKLDNLAKSQLVILASIIFLAVLLRVAFASGMGGFDEILYANSAWALTQGKITLEPILGAGRIGMYGPLALLYFFFGPSMLITQVWPLFCSVITLLLVYKIAYLLGDKKAALLAAFFWALLPLSIAYSTANLPDTVMAMLSVAAVYAWLLARQKRGWAAVARYLLCSFFLFWGLWTKQQIMITAGLLVLWSVAESLFPRLSPFVKHVKQRPLFPALIAGLLFGAFVIYYGSIQPVSFLDTLAVTSQDIYSELSTEPFFYLLFPFLIVVFIITIRSSEPSNRFTSGWFAFTFLALEWAPLSLDPRVYTPGGIRPVSDRTLLLLMVPFAIMAGLALSNRASRQSVSRKLVLVSMCLTVIVLMNRTVWIDKNLVLAISSLAILLLAILSLALPIIPPSNLSRHYIPVFFLVMGISIINPLQKNIDYSYGEIAYFRNLESTADLLTEDPTLPVYFYEHENSRSLNHLNFVSGYQLAPNPFDEMSGRMRFFSEPENISESSFVVVLDSSFLDQVLPTWWEIARFTQPPTPYFANPPEVHVYQVLSNQDAARQLSDAQRSVRQLNTPEASLELFVAAINANDVTAAFAAYRYLLEFGNIGAQYEDQIIKLIHHNLEGLSIGKASLINGSFVGSAENWDRSEADAAGLEMNVLEDGATGILHIANDSKNEIIPISQHITLKPNTAYAFQAEIRSTGQIASLYWWTEGVEYQYQGPSPNSGKFTPLAFIFITPAWDQLKEVLLAPVVLLGSGEVWIRGVSIVELVEAGP